MARSRKALRLDRENRKFLGVCAGIANFLEVEPHSVRLVFLGSCLFGFWFLVPMYFLLWFLLDESSAGVRSALADNHMVNHFKSVDYRKKLWRNTRDGKVLGVCAGIADYLEVNVFAVRVFFLVMVLLVGFPILFYFGAALVLDVKPDHAYQEEARLAAESGAGSATARDSWRQADAGAADGAESGTADSKTTRTESTRRFDRDNAELPGDQFSKRREFQYCARKFATLKTRLARLEAYVTSPRFKLHREFRNIS
jgi:phage shock protein C